MINDLVSDLIREGATSVTPDQQARAINAALLRYSSDKPRLIVVDVQLVGVRTLPALTDWVPDWSQLSSIEAPVGHWPPVLLETDSWIITATPTGEQINLRDARPTGDTIRVSYSALHSDNTVPGTDAEAVALWAAALLAEQLAALHSNDSRPSISADSTDQSNPARQWAQRAKEWRARYAALVGAVGITGAASDKPGSRPAGTVTNFELPDSRGRQRLYPRRRR